MARVCNISEPGQSGDSIIGISINGVPVPLNYPAPREAPRAPTSSPAARVAAGVLSPGAAPQQQQVPSSAALVMRPLAPPQHPPAAQHHFRFAEPREMMALVASTIPRKH